MSQSDSNRRDQTVHLAVTLRVREGMEAEFSRLLGKFAQQSLDFPGTTGVHLIHPVPRSGDREFGVMRSFESEMHCREFYESEMYQQYKLETAHLVEGAPIIRQLTGLEAFFRTGGHHLPPRWKMAVLTYVGVVPSVMFWSSILKPILSEHHWIVVVAISNAAVVATLAWAMMPLLTKLFDKWLHPTKPIEFNGPND